MEVAPLLIWAPGLFDCHVFFNFAQVPFQFGGSISGDSFAAGMVGEGHLGNYIVPLKN